MTCGICRRSQKDGFTRGFVCEGIEHVEHCKRQTDRIPKLSRENERFRHYFTRMLPGLFDGFGGCNYQSITSVLETYRVPLGERPVVMDKALVLVEVMRQIREAEKK